MQNAIRIRDVVRNETHMRGPDESVLRVPYELFKPEGSVRQRGELVEWMQGGTVRSGRTVAALLKHTQPGERVLLRMHSNDADDEWWLCEIEAVDGVFGTKEA